MASPAYAKRRPALSTDAYYYDATAPALHLQSTPPSSSTASPSAFYSLRQRIWGVSQSPAPTGTTTLTTKPASTPATAPSTKKPRHASTVGTVGSGSCGFITSVTPSTSPRPSRATPPPLHKPKLARLEPSESGDVSMSSATAPTATPRRDLSTDFSAAAREAQQQQQQHTKTTSSLFGFFSPMFSLLLGKQQGQGAQGVTVKDSEEMIRDETEEDEEQEEEGGEDSAATVDFVDELVASGNIDPDETLSHQEPTPAGTSGGGVTSVTSAEPASEVATGIYSVGCGGAAAAVAAAAAEEEGEEELAGAEEEEEEDWESGSGDCADEEDDDNNPYAFIRRLPYLPRGRVCLTRAIASKNPSSPRPTLVLDLDETLVHCSTEPISGVDLVFPVVWNGVEYRVYARKRPGLDAFMQQVSAWFEVVVFTASQQVYADKLLNILDPNFAWFKHRVFRDACVCVEGNYLKDLSVLGRDLATTVIIDNSPQAFGYQYNNGIPILSWFDAQDDTELIKLLPFLKSLAVADDVRPMIRSRYKLYKRIERH